MVKLWATVRAAIHITPVAVGLLAFVTFGQAQQSQTAPVNAEFSDINTVLMQSTFRIHGPSMDGTGTSIGTVFILGKVLKDDPARAAYVLVTATHVLATIKGNSATLLLRKKNSDGTYTPAFWDIQIRDGGKDLFLRHKTADVAVMYVRLPTGLDLPMLGTNLIADDKKLTDLEIHPGDELLCLGYPFGLTVNDWGFPILRSGIISSYPLTPAQAVKFIGFDFRVYGGNSGGPVYFKYTNRVYSTGTHLGETVFGIIGLVTEQVSEYANSDFPCPYSPRPIYY
jgi:S1-C subfamily serine protease